MAKYRCPHCKLDSGTFTVSVLDEAIINAEGTIEESLEVAEIIDTRTCQCNTCLYEGYPPEFRVSEEDNDQA